MNRREFFATAAAGVAATNAEAEAEVTQKVLVEIEAATTASPSGSGPTVNTDVSQLLRAVQNADVVVTN